MKKQFFTCLIGLVASAAALAQTKPYELEREMPVFLDQLKKELRTGDAGVFRPAEKGTDLSVGMGE